MLLIWISYCAYSWCGCDYLDIFSLAYPSGRVPVQLIILQDFFLFFLLAVRRRRSNPEVGFLVSLSRQQLQVEKDGVLKFDRVITNLGNAYNSQTGTFKCQIPGTYMFDLNLISDIGSYVEASITLNGVSKVTAISDHRDVHAGRDQGSAAAILVLRKGDIISVKIDWPVESQTVHGEGKTTFSGYLLRRHRVRQILY